MPFNKIITDDEADWHVLVRATADTSYKFAVPVGEAMPEVVRGAFERGMVRGWYTLIDVDYIMVGDEGFLHRVFLLTENGIIRRAEVVAFLGEPDTVTEKADAGAKIAEKIAEGNPSK